jgi:hypothetical protein
VMSNARIPRFNLDRADVAARPKLWPKDQVLENIRPVGWHLDGFGSFENGIRPSQLPLVRSRQGEGEAFPRDHLPVLRPSPNGRCS